jgi:hypothetical protein
MTRTFGVALLVLGLVIGGVAPAVAADDARWSMQAMIGPAAGSIGTSWLASGSVALPVAGPVAVLGEVGAVRRAPFDEAGEIALPLPGFVPSPDVKVNAYHVNANVLVSRWQTARVRPYVTAGLGSFTAETVGRGVRDGATLYERERETNFATNLGAGLALRLNDWLGLTGDYRSFFVRREGSTPAVHQARAGVTLYFDGLLRR